MSDENSEAPKTKRARKRKTQADAAPPETPAAEGAAPAAISGGAAAVLVDVQPERPQDGENPADGAAPEASVSAPEEGNAEKGAMSEPEVAAPVNTEELARTVEALLFAAEEPIAPREIARASGSDSATIRKVLKTLNEQYGRERRPWEVAEVAGGYRLLTRAEFFPAIQRLKTQTAQRKLTQAALETLALIAYRQPIGRAEVESVRGVGAGPVLRQLLDKKLIKISGRGTGLGQPLLYGTTDYFLEHFGLKSIQDLPKPGEFKNT